MFRSLLVPLDRSPFAEHALPLALSLARRSGARLSLAQVNALYAVDGPAPRPPFDADEDAVRRRAEQLYLDATAKWLMSVWPVRVGSVLLPGCAGIPESVADAVVQHARGAKTDLIVMATHGRAPV